MKTRVGIIGVGAVGSYFLAGLWEKENVEIIVIGDEHHQNKAYQTRIINQKEYHFEIYDETNVGHLDVLFIACKYQGLEKVCQMLPSIISKDTIVLSLLNGVDSEEKITQYIPKQQILYAYMMISSQRKGNEINFQPEITPGLFYGELDGNLHSERIKFLQKLFQDTWIHHTPIDNIIQGQWNKFALNMMHNLPQAVVGCGLGAYEDSQHLKYIAQKIRSEVVQVAKAKGIYLQEYIDTKALIQVRKDARYSTLQDLDAKRETEIEMFAGTLLRYAKQYDIQVPYCDMIYHLIKTIEEKNKGCFDYETI